MPTAGTGLIATQGALEGKVALVTGASSGIGEATGKALAREGAKVALAARRLDRLEVLARQIEETQKRAVAAFRTDLAQEREARSLVDSVVARFGRLDIVVNSAGVMLLAPLAEATAAEWRRMIELNLVGLMHVTQASVAAMRSRGGGHIVNIASLAGRIANPNASAYAATKFAVVGFTESVRREVYRDNIRVTVIEPGVVATELGEHIDNEAMRKGLAERTAAMDPLQAEDIAAAVVYAVTQPARVNVNEILLRPTGQER
jgi:NADP-dependent 3-hydroxy acid dehydrogenase YdfG